MNRRSFLKLAPTVFMVPVLLKGGEAIARPLTRPSRNWSKLADEWEARAPFGFTKDGEIAPALAVNHYGDPIPASEWKASDFYTPNGQCRGIIPTFGVMT